MKPTALAAGLALGATLVGVVGWLASPGDLAEKGDAPRAGAAPPDASRPAAAPAPPAPAAAPPVNVAPPPVRAAVRDVTPPGVTPPPRSTGPLERVPAKEIPRKPPGPPIPRTFRVAVLDDAATLRTGDIVIRLPDIEVPAGGETCRDATGRDWACGIEAILALRTLIRGRGVRCTLPADARFGVFTAACALGEQDLGAWLVRRGWARPKPGTDRLAPLAEGARAEKLGLWREAAPIREPLPDPSPPSLALDPDDPAHRPGDRDGVVEPLRRPRP